MLKFTLSAHAENVVKERSIKHEWLENVLTKPVRVVTAYFDRAMKGKL